MTEMERSLKNLRLLLPVVENIFGINNENVIAFRAFITEKESIAQKIQAQGLIMEGYIALFFDTDNLKEIYIKFNIPEAKLEQAA